MASRALARWLLILALAAAGALPATEAVPQAAEASQAASKAADVFLGQGPLGAIIVAEALVIIVLALVIRYLYKRIENISERALVALAEASASDERVGELLQGLKQTLDSRAHALGELSNLVALNGTEIRHGFANTSQALEGILQMLRDPRQLALNIAQAMREYLGLRRSGGEP
ncbi:hypothetical protein ADL19_19770 [Streptomyces purpurogeneiscleroticus]|nr:hypothetical protein ADL19_19770 [Streptomyces purpurogeneiscleroticus]